MFGIDIPTLKKAKQYTDKRIVVSPFEPEGDWLLWFKTPILYDRLYWDGHEGVPWHPAITSQYSVTTKAADHLLLSISELNKTGGCSFESKFRVDMTPLESLNIDLDVAESGVGYPSFICRVGVHANSGNTTSGGYDVYRDLEPGTKGVISLDVSGVAGDRFISARIQKSSNARGEDTTLKIYRVWGDE